MNTKTRKIERQIIVPSSGDIQTIYFWNGMPYQRYLRKCLRTSMNLELWNCQWEGKKATLAMGEFPEAGDLLNLRATEALRNYHINKFKKGSKERQNVIDQLQNDPPISGTVCIFNSRETWFRVPISKRIPVEKHSACIEETLGIELQLIDQYAADPYFKPFGSFVGIQGRIVCPDENGRENEVLCKEKKDAVLLKLALS